MNDQLTLGVATYDYSRVRIARHLYPLAAAWHDENPGAFDMVVVWGEEDTDAGMKALSMQCYIERLRNPRTRPASVRLTPTDAVYLVNHNLRRELTEYVQEMCPHLHFRTRGKGAGAAA